MKTLLLIGSGGFIGSVLRYATAQFVDKKIIAASFTGTLTVNIIGCFLIGLLLHLFEKNVVTPDWRLFLAVGFCGGFTTFSAFSTETLILLKQGQLTTAFLYVIGSVVLGVAASFAGLALARAL